MSLRDEIRNVLREHGLRLDRSMGQHFLIDEEVLQMITAAADLARADHVVEIGPGIGTLTRELVKTAGNVTAIELDERFLSVVRAFIGRSAAAGARVGDIKIIHGNALHIPFPDHPYKIVANIPYHITSPLLRHAFLESKPPESLTLLLQREVAEKICDTRKRGILTILVGLFGTPHLLAIIPPSSFLPPPAVDSAILSITTHPHPLASPQIIEKVFSLTKRAFAAKRKMLRNTLGLLPGGSEALGEASIDLSRRPETLTVEEWIALARGWDRSPGAQNA